MKPNSSHLSALAQSRQVDPLAGFHPLSACGHAQADGGPCLYYRVLVSANANGTELPAWLYAMGDRWTGGVKELTGVIWR